MIPNTLPSLIFIRTSILCLRAVAPLSISYCASYIYGFRFLPQPLEAIAFAEAAFYLFVSLPIQRLLERSPPTTTLRSPDERRELFRRCVSSVPDLEVFLSVWFSGRPAAGISREEVKGWLAWAFLYKHRCVVEDENELEEYLVEMEQVLGRKLDAGKETGVMRVSTDKVRVQHKPLCLYMFGIASDDLITYITLWRQGFQHYRLNIRRSLAVFPFRLHTIFSKGVSPAKTLSYYYRPHTAPNRLPVLFIHGVGAGLRTYTKFLSQFPNDGTGIIALEIMPVSMRVTTPIPAREQMVDEILTILDLHGWDKVVVVAHSYGTIIATHLLNSPRSQERIGPMLLIDPVTISIHFGEIPYNFIYRAPRLASEWQLHYFASTDVGIAHALTRRFDWSRNVLWREDIKGRDVTVVMSGEDIIVHTGRLREYLLADEELDAREVSADEARGKGVELMWFDGLNHGEIFDTEDDTATMVEAARRYSCRLV